MTLHRYWIEFERSEDEPKLPAVTFGCGVTAFNLDDAIALVQKYVFKDIQMPDIRHVETDVDVSTLEKNHVLPSIGITVRRGVWFPPFPPGFRFR